MHDLEEKLSTRMQRPSDWKELMRPDGAPKKPCADAGTTNPQAKMAVITTRTIMRDMIEAFINLFSETIDVDPAPLDYGKSKISSPENLFFGIFRKPERTAFRLVVFSPFIFHLHA